MAAASAAAVLVACLAACSSSPEPPQARDRASSSAARDRAAWPVAIDRSKLVDMTHPFDAATIYWPTNQPFRSSRIAWGRTPGGWWYASNDFSASEHGGTHTDAPIHFHEGGWTVDRIPLERLVGPAVVVDVSSSCAENPDYAASEADLRAWESAHGPFPEGAIVLLRTGWGARWPDRARYLGTAAPGDVVNLRFPGFSEAAARYLASTGRVVGAGLDTASLDPGGSKDFIAHQVFSAANIYGLENVAALDRLPPAGATLIALPMKIGDGTGAPTRVIAVLP